MSLENLRNQIDGVDAHILKLLSERQQLSAAIGEEKKRSGQAITDSTREAAVMSRVRQMACEAGLDAAVVESIYHRIISASKNVQGLTVAFQGEMGAYSQQAALEYFGQTAQTLPCEKLENAFAAVECAGATHAAVPVENSLEGSISKTYDLLLESPLRVCGEYMLRVSHCLIAAPQTTLDAIKRVYSHPQALGQCQSFLKHLGYRIIPSYDTAGAVKMLKEENLSDAAAVASARSAAIYDMHILASGIEDAPYNYTRFFILSSQDAQPTGCDKTSLVFSVKDRPGALYAFLKELSERNINLSKVESRPTRHKPWEYNFYLDFDGHRLDKNISEMLSALEEHALFIKVLGSYPRTSYGEHQ
ncbi:MAG: prephenate dehydratase [Dehalococcoidia bacterium]|nr:prephenate dehydratase [Dehalococcoidia bacterium]